MKSVLFLVRTAPYGSAAIPESARAALGFATMQFNIRYVLEGDATWALLPDQQPQVISAPAVPDVLANLADADVALYAETEAAAERGIAPEQFPSHFRPLSREQLADMIASADAVLTY